MSRARDLKRFLGRTWLQAFGWQIDGGQPAARKAVVVSAPHTSNWDLPFSLAVMWALELDVKWVGKHTLFQVPLWSDFLRSVGGIAVDRRGRHDAVKAIAHEIAEREEILLLVPPEGTRGVASRWKSGFYWIAMEAKVPLVLGYLDYARKRAGLAELFQPTGDITADFEKIRTFYRDVRGKHPERQGEIALREPRS